MTKTAFDDFSYLLTLLLLARGVAQFHCCCYYCLVVIFEGFLKEGKQPLRDLFLDGFARLNGIDEALLVFSVVIVIVFEILHLKVDEELIASKLFFLDFFFNILLNFVINFLKNFR